jgi:hypothetical protein
MGYVLSFDSAFPDSFSPFWERAKVTGMDTMPSGPPSAVAIPDHPAVKVHFGFLQWSILAPHATWLEAGTLDSFLIGMKSL